MTRPRHPLAFGGLLLALAGCDAGSAGYNSPYDPGPLGGPAYEQPLGSGGGLSLEADFPLLDPSLPDVDTLPWQDVAPVAEPAVAAEAWAPQPVIPSVPAYP